jgi:hypothetical protein
MEEVGCETNGKGQQKCILDFSLLDINRYSPCVEYCIQANVYVTAFPAPIEELLDPGINIINVLFHIGIQQFNGRNFTFCRLLI